MDERTNLTTTHPFAFLADHADWFMDIGLDMSSGGWTHTDDLHAWLVDMVGTADLADRDVNS